MAKSVTIKIGADTKDFIESLQKADKQINTTKKTADSLAKSLQVEYSDAKFSQAQKKYQSALQKTEEQAEAVRAKMKELEAAGKVDTADYEKLEECLARTEAKATDLRVAIKKVNDVKLDQAKKEAKELSNEFEKAANKVKGISFASAGIITGMVAASKSSATLGAKIDDLSQRFGVSAETIQEWQYVAVQCGVDSEVFTKALVKMRSAMADLSTGTVNNASKALQSLGISPDQYRTQEEMFDGIVDALSRVQDKTLQTAYANEIFGDKIATEMLQYINTATEDIKKFKDEFAAMPSLSEEQVAALAELDDTYYRLSESMKYATAQLGVALAPLMERVVVFIEDTVVPAIQKLADWFGRLDPFVQDLILGGLGILALAAPTLSFLSKIIPKISTLIKWLKNLNSAQLKTAAGFAAIGAAAALGTDIFKNWSKMSTVEKILKSLALAALIAAAAVTVFHASWSLGIAIGEIAAGVVAGLAAINAAKDEILPGEEDFSADNLNGKASSSKYDPDDYDYSSSWGGGNSYSDNSSNDSFNIVVNVTQPNATAEEIAEAVSREIATMAQSRR